MTNMKRKQNVRQDCIENIVQSITECSSSDLLELSKQIDELSSGMRMRSKKWYLCGAIIDLLDCVIVDRSLNK